jgi:hypothetical protein
VCGCLLAEDQPTNLWRSSDVRSLDASTDDRQRVAGEFLPQQHSVQDWRTDVRPTYSCAEGRQRVCGLLLYCSEESNLRGCGYTRSGDASPQDRQRVVWCLLDSGESVRNGRPDVWSLDASLQLRQWVCRLLLSREQYHNLRRWSDVGTRDASSQQRWWRWRWWLLDNCDTALHCRHRRCCTLEQLRVSMR